jgi:hypothetical protein
MGSDFFTEVIEIQDLRRWGIMALFLRKGIARGAKYRVKTFVNYFYWMLP